MSRSFLAPMNSTDSTKEISMNTTAIVGTPPMHDKTWPEVTEDVSMMLIFVVGAIMFLKFCT